MMNRIVSVAFFLLPVAWVSMGQAQDSDSQTLHQILAELRAIHEDMRVTQTTPLLVAELEMQQGVVNRSTENADNARAKANDYRASQKREAAELEREEEQLEKAATADERNALAQEIDRRKSNLAVLKTMERDFNVTLQDLEQRLQNAQDKLESIEAELNAAISRLSPTPKDAAQK